EAVPLTVDAAGLGSRMIAALIDTAIQGASILTFSLVYFASIDGGTTSPQLIAYLLVVFVLAWAYYPLFEGLWGGRTPGKRAQDLRVVDRDGSPVRWPAVLVRNLVRLVDYLPGIYAVGVVAMALTHPPRRLG